MISDENLAQLRALIESILDEKLAKYEIRKKPPEDITEKRRAAAKSRWGDALPGSRADRIANARKLGSHSEQEWVALLEVCEWQCVRCGDGEHGVVKDHIVPIYKGGSDLIANIQPLCWKCNGGKGSDTTDYRPRDWLERLQNACTQPTEIYKKPTKAPAKRLQKEQTFVLPDWVPMPQWEAYLEMRKKIKKPMTEMGLKMAVAKLEELRESGNHPARVLAQSVFHSWQGLFEVKDK